MNARDGSSGFTLIELIIFMVVVSVGLLGVLSAFNASTRNSADPLIAKQVLRVAEATMQEVLQKSYQNDPTDPTNISSTVGCTKNTLPRCSPNTPTDRGNYNDVDDYNNYAQTGITQIDGITSVSGLTSYSLAITVNNTGATLGGLSAAANQVKSVTVTVTGGKQSVTLVGYRTNYGY